MTASNCKIEFSKKIAQKIGRAISDFAMIRKDDKILIGLSGGKDSNLLLRALHRLRGISPVRFELAAAVIDPTETKDLAPLHEYARSMSVSLEVVRHPTFAILETLANAATCSLCANLRRGILASVAKRLGCNVLALGHHRDDAVETVFMNLIYTGRFACFHPHMYMSRSNLRVIRPMVYVPEHEIAAEASRLELPRIDFECAYARSSSRAHMKEGLKNLSLVAGDFSSNIIHALRESREDGTWGYATPHFKEVGDDFR